MRGEESLGFPDENGRHKYINCHGGKGSCGRIGRCRIKNETKQGRQKGAAQGVDKTHQECPDHRTTDGAYPADDNDDKGEDEDAFPMPDSTARIGPAITPARPASMVPSPKTMV